MESQKLIDSGYRSTKITMSFLRANTVSLIYPIPLVLLFLFGAAIAESLRLRFAPGGTGVFGTYTFSGMDNLLVFFVLYMVLLFVLIVLHELTHALFFLKGCENGWKSIKFGVKALTPYCHCKEATTVSIARRSCLAPLFSVSLPLAVISYISGSFLMYLLTVVMIFGSGADLWVFLKLRRYDGKTCYALEEPDEMVKRIAHLA